MRVFIDPPPKDHKCNEDLTVLVLSDGRKVEDTPENREEYWPMVRGGSVACSICGGAAIDSAYWSDLP